MTTGNPARLETARRMIEAFRKAGIPPRGAKPDAARRLQFSPAGWPVTRDALASQLIDRMGGVRQPMQGDGLHAGIEQRHFEQVLGGGVVGAVGAQGF